ncbi:MAG: S-layer homology domain-containing protein [Peptoniphilus sp. oral taxon 375]|nr:S-layer homology domain-containing protein [Peptoniphilus sp. oral taxon 375]
MRTKKRILTFVLALSMAIQTIIPTVSFAKESSSYQKENMVKVGTLDASNLMPLNGKTMQQINRLTKKAQDGQPIEKGTQLFSKPWFPNQRDPEDKDKPLYFGKVYVNLKTKGLTQQDGTELPFDWEGVFGRDEYGDLNKVKVIFVQLNYKEGSFSTETGIKGILETDTEGKHYWVDENGDPIKLPLYSKDFKPYKYEVYIERSNSERVNLILDGSFGTPDFTFAKPDPKTGEIVADVFMDNTLIQIASTKFVSEWNTDTIEDDRPVVEFSYNTHNKNKDGEEIEGYFEFPKNNKDIEIIRDDNGEDGKYIASWLEKVPTVDVADPDPESNDTYTLDRDNNRISYKGKTYNYTFNYDVINGGKLTMTEVLTLKFDANSGKFDSIQQDQEQVKEHEVIYTKNLTDTIEEPKKDRETFLGWGIKDEKNNFIKDKRGNILLVDESAFKNIKESQTYYAVWDKHPISADQLEVKESFKDGDTWVNDFIPELAKLKEQVKIKDANGVPQALTDDDTLQILDDSGNPIADKDLKDKLYEKLKEDPATEVSRLVTLKAKVTHKNGTSQTVDIPIKVIKNIYEAKTEEGKPNYVPNGYVKVTVDPTTKAEKPQKYFYYVNPKAKVVIPGENPVGTPGNNFINWTIPGAGADPVEYKLTERPRHQFGAETTITANYVGNIVEQKNEDKPKVPDDFVKVTVDTTDKATTETKFTKTFWVKKDTPVRIDVKDPVAKYETQAFSKWRQEKETNRFHVIDLTENQKFTKEETLIKAFYSPLAIRESEHGKPDTVPKNFIKVIFDPTDKAKDKTKIVWWVAPDKDAVRFDITSPTGKTVQDGEKILYTWKFDTWETKDGKLTAQGGKSYTLNTTKVKNGEVFKAQYTTDNIIPYDPTNPIDQPEGYVSVTFKAETGLSLKDFKAYYVKKNAGITLKKIQEDNTKGYPALEAQPGYAFDTWDPAEATEIKDKDIVVTAKPKPVSDVIEKKDGETKPEGYVEVTFVPTDKATDETKKIFWVNPEKKVTIPVKDPLGKTYYTFKGWKIGDVTTGENYSPTTLKKFTKNTIITATYTESDNIIPYDPKEPTTRPEGYVRVTFEADPGLKLTEQKAYYVKKNAGITLGNAELAKPKYEAQTGYKFDKWDKEDDLEIVTTDITVTAKATTLDDVVPKDNPQGGENDKPDGYITVTFKTTDKAGNVEKVVYINPTKAVTLEGQAPKVNPITGYEFADWDRPIKEKIQYEDKDVITAQFNKIGDVVPGDQTKPEGYVSVTFEKGDHGELSGTTSYWVKPEVEVTVEAPSVKAKTGYKFTNWDKETTLTAKKTDKEIKITAKYEKLDDIISGDQDKPEGYVTVTFEKGEHGNIESGQTVYYVNPEANPIKTLADIAKPTVKAETGYKFKNWNFADTKEIRSDITVVAQYDSIDDIVPGNQAKPDDYITVTFVKGDHGKSLTGQEVYYVNPNKAVVLESKAPTAVPNAGYQFGRWDVSIDQAIQYKDGAKITALYNDPGNISTTEVEGYAIVEFKTDAQGTLTGTTKYWVKPNVSVNVPEPTINPKDGYKFKDWDKSLTVNLQAGVTHEINARYEYLGDIIPQGNSDGSDKPKGYVTVKFKAVNGSLSGQTVYYVNPNKEVDLTNTADAITKRPDVGYTEKDGTWDPAITSKKYAENAEYTFTFKALDNIIPEKNDDGTTNTKPDGYVTVIFHKGRAGASIAGQTVYYVNPKAGKTLADIKKPTVTADSGYKFTGWDVTDKTEITGNLFVVAQYKEESGGDWQTGTLGPTRTRTVTVVEKEIVKVPAEKTFRKEVRYMQGYNNYFRPGAGLTRAEAAQILANALVEDGYRYDPNFAIHYKDIVGNEWYAKAIRITSQANVFKGYDTGYFDPHKKITRAEWIGTLRRFQELERVSGNHMQVRADHWAMGEIEAAYKEGWLAIYGQGLAKFRADEFIPRQEVAAVSNKAFNRVLDKTYIHRNSKNLINYKDVNPSLWSYEDILCASNGFIHDGKSFWGHKVDYKKDLYNINLDGYTVTKDKFQRLERR